MLYFHYTLCYIFVLYTAFLKVMTDILRALDTGNLAVLTLLDSSAAFDTVDPATLWRRLSVNYGLDGAVLSWFRSYLSGSVRLLLLF